uniref:Carboxylesterase type B domain-containing protein n=1 Tax=Plectus sambesii TaxID=2011161 RepID=A0A914WTU6_9BILA
MGGTSSIFGGTAPEVPSRRILTKYGPIEGKRIIHTGDHQVDAFLGIPFAKPPIGELRFQKPQPPDSWTEVLKTTKFGYRSIQSDFFWDKMMLGVGKDENCLFLNVFTPVWEPEDPTKGFPVMVFVHGGGYTMDSSVKYGDIGISKYLVRHGVVVVTIQYRLGALGFLSTGDDVCPGNLGLWDQTFALRWVNENIAAFNGDNSKVTVFGQSAGGASVDLLSISPHSRDLFHQVIPMAGNASCEWALSKKCLRTKPAAKFEKGLMMGKFDFSDPGIEFGPRIDGDFFPKSIAELREEAPKKKCLIGTAEFEGLLFAAFGSARITIESFDAVIASIISEKRYPRNYLELREKVKRRYLSRAEEHDKTTLTRAFMT